MSKIWSTAEIHPRDRVAYWIDAVCRNLIHADCEPERGQAFFAEMRVDAAGSLRVATLEGTPRLVTRSPRQIGRDPADNFLLSIHQAGTAMLSQYTRDTVPKPGDLVLHDMTRPWRMHVDSYFARTVLLFPRCALLNRIGDAERYIGMRVDGTVGVAGMLSPLLHRLPAHLDRMSDAARQRVADNVLDLVATAFLSTNEQPTHSAGMTLVRVKLWVETHLSEKLSAERVAGGCGLSVRHLSRLFEREGTSLMRYVWERRLARCHRDLTDPAMRGRPVSEIAFAAGFNDLSHFSRAYRARHLCAPRDVRARPMQSAAD